MDMLVISDTHDNLPAIKRMVKKADDIEYEYAIHCGDFIAPFTLPLLSKLKAKLVGVFGNNDGYKYGLMSKGQEYGMMIVEPPLELNIKNRRILVFHGFSTVERTVDIVNSLANSGKYDVILYGHTHKAEVRKLNGTLIVNPGEACGYLSGKYTFATVDLKNLEAEIVYF